jgi:hypothetical protein
MQIYYIVYTVHAWNILPMNADSLGLSMPFKYF